MKLNKLPIFAHSATRYDNNFLLSGITDDFKPQNRISKSAENFLEIDVTLKTKDSDMDIDYVFLIVLTV